MYKRQLIKASRDGDTNTVRKLLKRGANINAGLYYNNETSLICASSHKHLNLVKYLIQNGADVNIPDKTGRTPLIHASASGSLEIVKYLIEHGAEVNHTTDSKITALIWAIKFGRLTITKYLVQHGADYTHIKNMPIFQEIIMEEVNKLKGELTNTYLTIERSTPQMYGKSAIPKSILLRIVYEKTYREYCLPSGQGIPPIQLIALANILKIDHTIDTTWIELCDKIKHVLYLLL